MGLREEIKNLDAGIRKLMLHSINANRESSELLLKVLEVSTDGYWDWHVGSGGGKEEDYEYLSPRLKEQLGYKEDELPNVPSSWMNIVEQESLDRAYASIQKHFETKGEHEFIVECKYTHKEGHDVWILCRGAVIEWNEDGSPKRMVGTHTDITKLKKI